MQQESEVPYADINGRYHQSKGGHCKFISDNESSLSWISLTKNHTAACLMNKGWYVVTLPETENFLCAK